MAYFRFFKLVIVLFWGIDFIELCGLGMVNGIPIIWLFVFRKQSILRFSLFLKFLKMAIKESCYPVIISSVEIKFGDFSGVSKGKKEVIGFHFYF